MKTIFKLLLTALLAAALPASAYDFIVDGLCYDKNSDGTSVSVTSERSSYPFGYTSLSGALTIPPSVTYSGTTYSVTSIGYSAFRNCSGLTSVTIPNSVTSIGKYAFSGCSGLTSVTIPNSVTEIDCGAFNCCSGLTSVTIGNSVTKIGEEAFYECTGLTSVTIPNSVTEIGYDAFCDCSSLASVTIPNSVTSIGSNAFYNTAWYNNQPDGLVYAGLVAYKYKGTMPNGTSIEIKEGTLGIAEDAFSGCSGLTSVTIPNSVTEIDRGAFSSCSGLTSLNIPNSVTEIGSSAFYECTGLTSVTIPNSVTSIGNYAFCDCSSLASVAIPNSVTSIGSNAFYNTAWYNNQPDGLVYAGLVAYKYKGTMPNGTSIEIKEGTLGIAEDAFSGCSGLTSVTIPNSITKIGEEAFYECSGLTSVTIGNSVNEIGDDAFSGCNNIDRLIVDNNACANISLFPDSRTKLKTLILGNSVTSINEEAFSGCNCLTSVTFGNSVTSIGRAAFSDCTGLNSLTIPNSVTEIGVWTFYGCSGLTSVTIGNSVISIGSWAFWGCSRLTSVTIPNSVTTIGMEAFGGCSGLTNVTIGNSVTNIGEEAFSRCTGLTNVTIPNSVSSIGYEAFWNCTGLTSVTIGNSVTEIGVWTFYGCSKLKDTYCHFDEPSDVTLGDNVFVDVPSSMRLHVKVGKEQLFRNAEQWNAFNIVDDIDYILFADNNVKAICLANWDTNNDGHLSFAEAAAVTDLGTVFQYNSFNGDITSFDELQYFTGLTKINDYAFSNCSGLTSVTIPNSVTSIGNYAFYYCSGLTSVTIPNSVTSIGDYAFGWCRGLTSVTIPNSVTSIGNYAFYYCSGLTSVTIPDSVTSIGNYAFYYCSGLTSVTIPNSVTSIGNNAFYYCSGLTSVTIPNSVTSIGSSAFSGCSGLRTVEIGNSVTSIGSQAFYNCTNLSLVTSFIDSPQKVFFNGRNWFNNVKLQDCELNVFQNCVEQYRRLYPWAEFGTINGINYVMGSGDIGHLRGMPETVVELPISMTNITDVSQLQFDITLPKGITVEGDYDSASGIIYYDQSIRLDDVRKTRSHYADVRFVGRQDDATTYRVVIGTMQSNAVLKGHNGTVAYLKISVPQYHDAGEYDISLSNITLSGANMAFQQSVNDTVAGNVRFSYLLGDVNGDVAVDVADYHATIRNMLTLDTPRFYEDAANVFNDEVINVIDLQGIINIIAGISAPSTRHAPAMDAPSTEVTLTARQHGDDTVSLVLDNDVDISAMQLDVALPTGVTISSASLTSRSERLQLDYATLDDGIVRLLVSSPQACTIAAGGGSVIELVLEKGNGGTVTVNDILAVERDCTPHLIVDLSFEVQTTGIDKVEYAATRIQVGDNCLTIESDVAGEAQVTNVNGISRTVDVRGGTNIYELPAGVYVVSFNGKAAKVLVR